jgi:Zn-dependent metalloprotease
MTYIGKRKFVLSHVLERKREHEQQLSELKSLAELKSAELKQVGDNLEEKIAELRRLDETTEETSQKLIDFYEGVSVTLGISMRVVEQADGLVKKYYGLLDSLNRKLIEVNNEFNKLKLLEEALRVERSAEDQRLSKRASDLGIYERRLQKSIDDADLNDKIKLVLP